MNYFIYNSYTFVFFYFLNVREAFNKFVFVSSMMLKSFPLELISLLGIRKSHREPCLGSRKAGENSHKTGELGLNDQTHFMVNELWVVWPQL